MNWVRTKVLGLGAAWHYGRGCGAYYRGRYAKALIHFQRSEELEPNTTTRAFILKAKNAERGLSDSEPD